MRVAVLGAGSIGFGTAAFLCDQGHDPILWSPSGERTRALAAGQPLVAIGSVVGTFRPRVAGSAAEAVADAEAVVLTVPGYGHRAVLDAAAPHLKAGVPFIISSHCSLGALYLSKKLAERGVALPIVAWGTTVPTGRQKGPAEVNVTNVRKRVDYATVPVAAADEGGAISKAIFGDRFMQRDDVLAISLSNLNPQNHMGIALANLTRMEKGETWGQNDCITEKVGRLLEALDAERIAIARALGYSVRTIFEHFQLSFGAPPGTVAE
ncbi:MAG: NAD/NADP octopine/nopaline dehydrogenase family protein, partial [Alphaproteobacteria bacterium]